MNFKQSLIVNATTLAKLSKSEILCLLRPVQEKLKGMNVKFTSSMRKAELINIFSTQFCDDSTISSISKPQQPQTLSAIVKQFIQLKIPKLFLNSSYASAIFPSKLESWRNKSASKSSCKIAVTQNPPFW